MFCHKEERTLWPRSSEDWKEREKRLVKPISLTVCNCLLADYLLRALVGNHAHYYCAITRFSVQVYKTGTFRIWFCNKIEDPCFSSILELDTHSWAILTSEFLFVGDLVFILAGFTFILIFQCNGTWSSSLTKFP